MTYFPARAVIDLAAIRANVSAITNRVGAAQVMAVVKADAYGHGLVPCARAAVQGGASWLGVAQLAEGVALREAGFDQRILAWLYGPGAPIAQAVALDIDLSVAAPWALDQIAEAARGVGRSARIHIKVDTGLGRNGVPVDQFPQLLSQALTLQAEGVLNVVGIWSHLAWADEPSHPTVAHQLEALREAYELAERRGAQLEVRHIANSAATLLSPELHLDLVRPGLAVYGLSPVPLLGDPEEFGLHPAMRLEAELALVKRVPADHGVSYSHTYRTSESTYLAVLPLGYADGIPRHASNAGPVLVGGRRVTIAGRVCMDQTMLDLGPLDGAGSGDGAGTASGDGAGIASSNGATIAAGTTAVVFGAGADGEPTAEDWARAAGTISYEIVSRLGARVPRVYIGEEGGADRIGEQGEPDGN